MSESFDENGENDEYRDPIMNASNSEMVEKMRALLSAKPKNPEDPAHYTQKSLINLRKKHTHTIP